METFAITWGCHGIAREVKSHAIIEHPLSQQKETFWAIWDTGATNSVIHSNVVAALGLIPSGVGLSHGVHGPAQVNTYIVNIGLVAPTSNGNADSIIIEGLQVTESPQLIGGDMLIGMDIISMGDFSVTTFDGNTMFSFRVPSLHHIDYRNHHRKVILPIPFNGQLVPIKKPLIRPSISNGKGKRR